MSSKIKATADKKNDIPAVTETVAVAAKTKTTFRQKLAFLPLWMGNKIAGSTKKVQIRTISEVTRTIVETTTTVTSVIMANPVSVVEKTEVVKDTTPTTTAEKIETAITSNEPLMV